MIEQWLISAAKVCARCGHIMLYNRTHEDEAFGTCAKCTKCQFPAYYEYHTIFNGIADFIKQYVRQLWQSVFK